MNEQPMQEKEFNSILNKMNELEGERDKLIYEIDDIIDRLCNNRKPSVEQKPPTNTVSSPTNTVINVLRLRMQEMDVANERLKAISNRLNELV